MLICTGTSYFSCKKILKIHPSEALRPAAAKTAKPCIFEKLPFWDKLGFNASYNLRDISRSKIRAFMGVFGTCMGMMIMELGLGTYDTVDYVRDWYFRDIQNYEYQVILNDSCTHEDAEELKAETGGELVAMQAISIAAKDYPTSDGIISCNLAVTEGEQLYCVSDRELETTPIPKGTVAMAMKQAKKQRDTQTALDAESVAVSYRLHMRTAARTRTAASDDGLKRRRDRLALLHLADDLHHRGDIRNDRVRTCQLPVLAQDKED